MSTPFGNFEAGENKISNVSQGSHSDENRLPSPVIACDAWNHLGIMDDTLFEDCFGEDAVLPTSSETGPLDICTEIDASGYLNEIKRRPISRQNEGNQSTPFAHGGEKRMRSRESQARILTKTVGKLFPPGIWNFCKLGCFGNIAMNVEMSSTLDVLIGIHQRACELYDEKGLIWSKPVEGAVTDSRWCTREVA